MTSEDVQLDPEFFLTHQPLTLYRLARARYANLSGVGAAVAPGRWNYPGQEAIYTSTEVSVPLLERLAHTPKDLIPSNLALMKIQLSGEWELSMRFLPRSSPERVRFGQLLSDPRMPGWWWFYPDLATAARDFRAGPLSFADGIGPFALAVPSVIVPVWNVVLYPQAAGFWEHVSLVSVEAFEFDPRLFPPDAGMEAR